MNNGLTDQGPGNSDPGEEAGGNSGTTAFGGSSGGPGGAGSTQNPAVDDVGQGNRDTPDSGEINERETGWRPTDRPAGVESVDAGHGSLGVDSNNEG